MKGLSLEGRPRARGKFKKSYASTRTLRASYLRSHLGAKCRTPSSSHDHHHGDRWVKRTGLVKFSGDDYIERSKSMRAVLLNKGLWEAMSDRPEERPSAAADAKEKRGGARKKKRATKKINAFALLHLYLKSNMLVMVEECSTAYEV